MKQNITKEQLQELSEKAQGKLREWCSEHRYVVARWDSDPQDYTHGCVPLLSIGQMIEYLDGLAWIRISSLGGIWDVIYAEDKSIGGGGGLCDVLWEAVKEDLERLN